MKSIGRATKIKANSISRISIIVPCHNSEENITRTFEILRQSLPNGSEIIFVENGSSDGTLKTLRNEVQKNETSHFSVKVLSSKQGLGNALRLGVLESTGKTVAFMADDLPFGTQEIKLGLGAEQREEYLLAISKYLPESVFKTSFSRNALGKAFIALRKLLLKIDIRDTQGSFVGDGNLLRQILGRTREEGFLITTEVYLLAKHMNVLVEEIPCLQSLDNFRPSTLSLRASISTGFGLMRLRYRNYSI